MPSTFWKVAVIATAVIAPLIAGGCVSAGRYGDLGLVPRGPSDVAAAPAPEDVRRLPTFDGYDGTQIGWQDVLDAVAWADVIIVGEQHDDAVGHVVQRAIVEDTVREWPGSALSMEMLERDEQVLVADYFEGVIDAEQFAKLTHSTNWGGEGMWPEWYQPIVDAALGGGGRVIAANAPRRYVRLARREGYERLDALPSERRILVDHPSRLPTGRYRDRFWDVMTSPEIVEAEAPKEEETTETPMDESQEEDKPIVHVPRKKRDVEALFRSQLVWDTTMARSIAAGRRAGARKVVHLVGQFHSDFEGGTVQQLRAARPGDRILVISMQREWPDALREEDIGRADIVIYTGERPPEPEPEPEPDEDAEPEEGESDEEDVPSEEASGEEAGDDETPAETAPTSQPDAPDDDANDDGDDRTPR